MQKILIAVKLFVGAALFALGFRLFLYPNNIVPGGVTGVAMALQRFTGLSVGFLAFLVNIPIFLTGWLFLGHRFLLGSLVGAFLSSAMIDLMDFVSVTVTNDPILAALYGGVFSGAGLGLVFSTGFSTGGTDIVALLIRRYRRHCNTGHLLLLVDVIVIGTGSFVLGEWTSAMYALLSVFLASRVIDLVLYGFSYSKVCYIISDHHKELVRLIDARLERGVTILHGTGAYTGQDKKILLCVIKHRQIVLMKDLIRETDPAAFVFIQDAREVFGLGFALRP